LFLWKDVFCQEIANWIPLDPQSSNKTQTHVKNFLRGLKDQSMNNKKPCNERSAEGKGEKVISPRDLKKKSLSAGSLGEDEARTAWGTLGAWGFACFTWRALAEKAGCTTGGGFDTSTIAVGSSVGKSADGGDDAVRGTCAAV
jgi:hypothetical protein